MKNITVMKIKLLLTAIVFLSMMSHCENKEMEKVRIKITESAEQVIGEL